MRMPQIVGLSKCDFGSAVASTVGDFSRRGYLVGKGVRQDSQPCGFGIEDEVLYELLLFGGEASKKDGEVVGKDYRARHFFAFSRIHSRKSSRFMPSGIVKRTPDSIDYGGQVEIHIFGGRVVVRGAVFAFHDRYTLWLYLNVFTVNCFSGCISSDSTRHRSVTPFRRMVPPRTRHDAVPPIAGHALSRTRSSRVPIKVYSPISSWLSWTSLRAVSSVASHHRQFQALPSPGTEDRIVASGRGEWQLCSLCWLLLQVCRRPGWSISGYASVLLHGAD